MLKPVQPSRRTFLVGAGRFAAASALASAVPLTAAAEAGSRRIETSALRDLARAVPGVVLPDDPFFGDYVRPNNLRFRTLPTAVARCATDQDVQACVAWVRKHGAKFAVRSGGHNYAGFSTTPGLLIDMTPMSSITALPGGDGLVKVCGGALNGMAYQALERLNRTITHGRCTTVGAAGFLLGGGIGFNMRLYGMGSDLLHATSIVTADGELHADIGDGGPDRDLFWACRGGAGGNFGINTSFTLRTFPVVGTVAFFDITWTTDVDEVLYTLLTRLAEAPPEFGSKISVTNPPRGSGSQQLTVSILGQLHKCGTTVEAILGPVLEKASKTTITPDMPYWPAQDLLSEFTYPYFYQEKSSYMKASDIAPDAVATMVRLARRMPGTCMANSFKFFQVGGKVNATPADATAYVHRGYDWLFSSEVNWWDRKDPQALVDENLAWQERFYAAVNEATRAAGAFQNFPDPSLKDWSTAYYGSNYAKLRRVKTAYDPSDLFTYRQGIKPL